MQVSRVISAACLSVASLGAQTYSFQAIQSFQPNGENNKGELVGQLGAPIAGIYQSGEFYAAFGDPTLPPGGGNTIYSGINDAGAVVGSSDVRGFLLKNGVYTTITVNGASCLPYAINNAGVIAGTSTSFTGGFVLNGSSVTKLPYPVTGINNSNDLVMEGLNNGYYVKAGAVTPIVFPGSTYTYVAGLSDAGAVVGFYSDAQNVEHGFVWNSGVYTTLDYPNATFTRTQAIDKAGRVAGFALTSSGLVGFVATPAP